MVLDHQLKEQRTMTTRRSRIPNNLQVREILKLTLENHVQSGLISWWLQHTAGNAAVNALVLLIDQF
jgi:hypothetical protein